MYMCVLNIYIYNHISACYLEHLPDCCRIQFPQRSTRMPECGTYIHVYTHIYKYTYAYTCAFNMYIYFPRRSTRMPGTYIHVYTHIYVNVRMFTHVRLICIYAYLYICFFRTQHILPDTRSTRRNAAPDNFRTSRHACPNLGPHHSPHMSSCPLHTPHTHPAVPEHAAPLQRAVLPPRPSPPPPPLRMTQIRAPKKEVKPLGDTQIHPIKIGRAIRSTTIKSRELYQET